MKESNKEIKLNHNALDLYNIVLDIEKYPEYLPWCKKIEIIEKKTNEIKANMIVNYKIFPSQKFTSKVIYNIKNLSINTKYIEGPLKDLNTLWQFKKIQENKCRVFFKVNFEFKNIFHQKFAELFFPLVEEKMITSFIERADQILD